MEFYPSKNGDRSIFPTCYDDAKKIRNRYVRAGLALGLLDAGQGPGLFEGAELPLLLSRDPQVARYDVKVVW